MCKQLKKEGINIVNVHCPKYHTDTSSVGPCGGGNRSSLVTPLKSLLPCFLQSRVVDRLLDLLYHSEVSGHRHLQCRTDPAVQFSGGQKKVCLHFLFLGRKEMNYSLIGVTQGRKLITYMQAAFLLGVSKGSPVPDMEDAV